MAPLRTAPTDAVTAREGGAGGSGKPVTRSLCSSACRNRSRGSPDRERTVGAVETLDRGMLTRAVAAMDQSEKGAKIVDASTQIAAVVRYAGGYDKHVGYKRCE